MTHSVNDRNVGVKRRWDRTALDSSRAEFHDYIYLPFIHRKASCACGGGCPRCRDEKSTVQPKSRIGQPNDKYEQEADRVADQVMRMPEPTIQRQPLEEEDEEIVHPKAASGSTAVASPAAQARLKAMQSGGQPLSRSLRTFFEPHLGYDLAPVRLHTDAQAAEIANDLNARAFTLGRNVVFGAGQFAPETEDGRRLLAHELTHVSQQQNHVQLQLTPARHTASSTGWSSLPGPAQKVLMTSFKHRSPGEWLWKYHGNAGDCFDKNLTPDRQRSFRNVYDALNRQGLWNKYVKRVIEVWTENVDAIKFEPTSHTQLRTHLQSNTRFCRDTWSDIVPKWRQVVAAGTSGLHIVTPSTGSFQAHIDRIAPIQGREPNGMCKRKYFPEGLRHLVRDKWGWSRSTLLLGASSGLATTIGGPAKGLIGLDVTLGYRFLSLLGEKLRLQGELRGEVSNLFASGSAGVGLEAKYKMLSGSLFAGGIAGDLSPGVLGGTGTEFGAGISTSAGLYLSLEKIALLLGVKYQVVKDLANKDPALHRLMVSANIRLGR